MNPPQLERIIWFAEFDDLDGPRARTGPRGYLPTYMWDNSESALGYDSLQGFNQLQERWDVFA